MNRSPVNKFRKYLQVCLVVLNFTHVNSILADDDAWQRYYTHSNSLRQLDQNFIANELVRANLNSLIPAKPASRFVLPSREEHWFASAEAIKLADNVISYQSPSGGWSKRTDILTEARVLGQAFGVEENYIPTFDNNATTDQIQFLTAIIKTHPEPRFLSALERAYTLLLDAQYPNGCWPQSFPLVGGYHDHITFNDRVMVNILEVLQALVLGNVPVDDLKTRAGNALEAGIQCILQTQVEVGGKLTAWGAQHDVKTLRPESARAYEMVSLASEESQEIVELLMAIPSPSVEVVRSVDAAVRWFEEVKVEGFRWQRVGDEIAELVEDGDGSPLWSRFYELGSNRPVFGDRDGSVSYEVNEISLERRLNYRWYTGEPSRLMEQYERWQDKLPTE